jgi:GntR family transcriptional regulator, transcriptional repressor for pyruvate dehydrogenase complex
MAARTNSILKRPPTLTDAVAKMLSEAIKSGQYKPGEQLPTETELCMAYGVSRPVLREAISQLKFDGLVIPQQGRGVFVSETAFKSSLRLEIPNFEDQKEVLKIFELLLAVEVYYTGLAAKHRTKNQLSAIKKALDNLIKAISTGELGSEEDLSFHTEIVKASNNSYFVTLAKFLEDNVRHAIRTARKHTASFKTLDSAVLNEHEAIYAAIETQNIEKARQAAETHLNNAMARTGGGFPAPCSTASTCTSKFPASFIGIWPTRWTVSLRPPSAPGSKPPGRSNGNASLPSACTPTPAWPPATSASSARSMSRARSCWRWSPTGSVFPPAPTPASSRWRGPSPIWPE